MPLVLETRLKALVSSIRCVFSRLSSIDDFPHRFLRRKRQNTIEVDLRLPLEVILYIIDLALSSSHDPDVQDRIGGRLVCVNRTFSRLYARRKYRTAGLKSGAELPELLGRLKVDRAGSEWIEGIEVTDLNPYYSRRRLFQHWSALQKQCKNLQFVQLGDLEVEPEPNCSVNSFSVHAMKGAFFSFPPHSLSFL
jgi:hypothetical protein